MVVLYNTLLVFINSHIENFGRYEMQMVFILLVERKLTL